MIRVWAKLDPKYFGRGLEMASNIWDSQQLVPQAVAVEMLNRKLGAGISWSRFLDEDRRYSRRQRPPIIPVVRSSGRCWYQRKDIEQFVRSRK
jgi:hypothetical protein